MSHVKLRVNSIERSLLFYERLLRFKVVRKNNECALLSPAGSSDNNTLIHLSKVDSNHRSIKRGQTATRRAGLFHFAILLPSRKYLANIYKHLMENSRLLTFEGAADHLVSESLYFRDPDSIGLEIYRDRDQSGWVRTGRFQVKMSTEFLDLEQLYGEADSIGHWRIPPKTVIGHVHLQVSNLEESKKFYSDFLGLHHTCSYPRANFFAGDSYHHHVATNTWLGTNIQRADSSEVGLDYFALRVESKKSFKCLVEHLRNKNLIEIQNEVDKIDNRSIFMQNPDGIKLQIYSK